MHNYERSYNWFPCKFKLPSLGGAGGGPASQLSPPWEGLGEVSQVRTPLPWGGAGGGFLLFSFTKPFARQPVLRNKSITVGNTWVLSLFATHWLWGCYEKQGKIQRKIMAKSVAICVILASKMRQNAHWNDADEPVSWCRWACNLTQIARWQAINDETKAVFSLCNSLKTAFPFLFRRFSKCLFNALFFYIFNLKDNLSYSVIRLAVRSCFHEITM